MSQIDQVTTHKSPPTSHHPLEHSCPSALGVQQAGTLTLLTNPN